MDINVSPSLFRWIKKFLEKLIFQNAYIISHHDYLSWKKTSKYKQVEDLFEYSLFLENKYLTNEENPASKIYIKSIDKNICEIRLLVIAEKGKLQYQDHIYIRNREQGVTVVFLNRIPLKEVNIVEDGIATTYDNVKIEGEVIKEGGKAVEFSSLWGMPTYTEFLNSSWDRKWGIIWNLDYLLEQKHNFRNSIVFKLAGPLAYLEAEPSYRRQSISRTLYRYWCILVVNIIANEKVVNFIFWLLVATRIKRLQHKT